MPCTLHAPATAEPLHLLPASHAQKHTHARRYRLHVGLTRDWYGRVKHTHILGLDCLGVSKNRFFFT